MFAVLSTAYIKQIPSASSVPRAKRVVKNKIIEIHHRDTESTENTFFFSFAGRYRQRKTNLQLIQPSRDATHNLDT